MRRAALPIAAAVLIAGCGGGGGSHTPASSSRPASPAATVDKITIKNFAFKPVNATVRAGTKLTFDNIDSAAHTATSDKGGAFDTGGIPKGTSKTITLSQRGTFSYHCDFHPVMKATIKVQ